MRNLVAVLLLVIFFSVGVSSAVETPKTPTEIVIDQLKKTVLFLSTTWEDPKDLDPAGKPKIKSEIGTGFLIFISLPELGKDASGDDQGYYFLVTAKHMIRQLSLEHKPGPYAKKVTVYFNKVPTGEASELLRDQVDIDIIDARGDLNWFVDDADPVADVALHPVFLNPKLVDFITIGQKSFMTKDLFAEKHVNENDEVLFTGLFTSFIGSQKNYPIVRHGHLALLPNEDIAIDVEKPNKKTQIYMAEVTSFGGNSGSPVFLRLGALREGLSVDLKIGYNYYLIGLLSGYYPDEEAKQNSGIALIVPAEKINEILSGALVKAFLSRMIAIEKFKKGDLKSAEVNFKDSIAVLERRAPESSQLIATLKDYAGMLQQAKRSDEALAVQTKAEKLAARKVTETLMP